MDHSELSKKLTALYSDENVNAQITDLFACRFLSASSFKDPFVFVYMVEVALAESESDYATAINKLATHLSVFCGAKIDSARVELGPKEQIEAIEKIIAYLQAEIRGRKQEFVPLSTPSSPIKPNRSERSGNDG